MANKISLEAFVSGAIKNDFSLRGIAVFQNGEKNNEFYWEKWGNRWRHNIFSATKMVTSLAMGIAVDEGLFKLSDRVMDIFKEEVEEEYPPLLEELTIQHLLTMSCGHDEKAFMASFERDGIPNWLHYAVNLPVVRKPGEVFMYENAAPFMCSAMITKKTGLRMVDYLIPRLFDPLNIPNPQWFTSPDGYNAGSGSLHLDINEMARIGQLFLNEGEWNGKQLVSKEWIRESTSNKVSTEYLGKSRDGRLNPDNAAGYGYFIWLNAEGRGYRAIGNGNQLINILPEKNAVIAIASQDDHRQQDFLDLVWNTVYPQL